MRRVVWMAGVAAAVAAPAVGRAAAYDDMHGMPAAADSARVAAPGAVTGVSVRSSAGRAELVIGLDGDIDVQDFTLDSPQRIVIDLHGATLKVRAQLYDGIVRAGISSVRVAQFTPTTVRVVLDVDKERKYDVARTEHELRVTMATSDVFDTWSMGAVPTAVSPPASKASVAPAVTPVASATMQKSVASEPFMASPFQQTVPRVTTTFRDAPLQDVLALFADRSGRTIIGGGGTQGQIRITAEINDQPWDVALKMLLQYQGLAALEDPNSHIIIVDSYANLRAQAASEPLVQRVIALNYAKASELAVTVGSLLSSDCSGGSLQVVGSSGGGDASAGGQAAGGGGAGGGGTPGSPQTGTTGKCPPRGSVTIEPASNKLIITETQSRIDSLVSYVKSFDFKVQQVNISAKFISIDRTDTKRLGVSYALGSSAASFNALNPQAPTSATGQPFQVSLGGDAFAGVANAGRSFSSTASSAINLIYNTTIGNFSLTSFIDALTAENLSDVTAQPSVNTLDKRTATLFVGDNVAFLLTPPTAPGAIQSAAPTISTVQVGIKLTVTPSISANRTIRLVIAAEQSSLTSITAAGPSSSQRQTSVEVIVKDGETFVISGLEQTIVTKSRRGIPILGQLPMIGKLFSENESIETRNDLLVLITPHILDDPDPSGKSHHTP